MCKVLINLGAILDTGGGNFRVSEVKISEIAENDLPLLYNFS